MKMQKDEAALIAKAMEAYPNAGPLRNTVRFLTRAMGDGVNVKLWPRTADKIRQAIEYGVAKKIYSPDELKKVRQMYATRLLPGSMQIGPEVEN